MSEHRWGVLAARFYNEWQEAVRRGRPDRHAKQKAYLEARASERGAYVVNGPCDDECTDPECRWFFIHGERSGRPVGIESAVSSALCTDCRVRLRLDELTYVPALGGYFCAACWRES